METRGKIRVLCVDDLASDRLLIRHALEKESDDFEMIEAVDADSFHHLLEKGGFDVVLTDFNILGFEGLEIIRRVKQKYPRMPVIVVTGTGSEEVAVKALKQGADDYVIKTPHHIAQLPHTIQMVLESQRRADALHEAQERFRRLAENSPDLIYRYRLSPTPGFEYVNPASTRIVGYTPEEHYADPELGMKIVHPDDLAALDTIRQGRDFFYRPIQLRWLHKDGRIVWTEQINIPVYDENGNLIAIEGTARDITEKKQVEEKLQQALQERQRLFEEFYGRINNNLQMIISFIELRARKESDEKVLLSLKDLKTKILSLALVQRRLYETKNLWSLDLAAYLDDLTRYIRQDFSYLTNRSHLDFSAESLQVSWDAGVKLGFVFAELLTNAFIHGFPNGRDGRIKVSLYLSPTDELILEVADDGVGVAESFDFRRDAKLGLEMIMQLIQDLFSGRLELMGRRGLHWKITIPKKGYQPQQNPAA
ncbi:MAG: response regulator [candidate division KSB1 bacterium]|nr:response regulator [candidate division KSB1 bacterium]